MRAIEAPPWPSLNSLLCKIPDRYHRRPLCAESYPQRYFASPSHSLHISITSLPFSLGCSRKPYRWNLIREADSTGPTNSSDSNNLRCSAFLLPLYYVDPDLNTFLYIHSYSTVTMADIETQEYTNGTGIVNDDSPSSSLKDAEKGSPAVPVISHGLGEVFGDETNSQVKYRTMHWWQAGMIMIAETISLGILSLPSVLATVGIVPYVLLSLFESKEYMKRRDIMADNGFTTGALY